MTTTTFRSLHESPRKFTHKFVVTHADLTEATANTAQDVTLITLPAYSVVKSGATYLKTAFSDASDTAFNTTALIVGDSGDTDRIIASQELNVNGSEVLAKASAVSSIPYAYVAATAIKANFASMADKALADLDGGELHIFLEVAQLDTLS